MSLDLLCIIESSVVNPHTHSRPVLSPWYPEHAVLLISEQVPSNMSTAVLWVSQGTLLHCYFQSIAGIRRYPEESPESDPTSCILCCSLTAVGGSKNGVKPELARIKTKNCWKKGGMVDWRVRGWGWLVVTGNGRPWNPDATMITTIITTIITIKTTTT